MSLVNDENRYFKILPPFQKCRNALPEFYGDLVTRELPADDDETSCVNEGPTPSQLCQGPWPLGHGPLQS